MAAAAAAVSAAGMLYGAYASYQAGKAQQQIGRQNAAIELQLSRDQATQADRDAFMRMGEMRAAAGASGGTAGSFADIFGDAAAQNKLQQQTILYAGEVNAARAEAGANFARVEGTTGAVARIGAAATDIGRLYYNRPSGGAGSNLVYNGGGFTGSGSFNPDN